MSIFSFTANIMQELFGKTDTWRQIHKETEEVLQTYGKGALKVCRTFTGEHL